MPLARVPGRRSQKSMASTVEGSWFGDSGLRFGVRKLAAASEGCKFEV